MTGNGTYHASKIRRARKARVCDEGKCAAPIAVGDEYLDYRFGLYSHWRVCLKCGLQHDGTGFRFACSDVVKRAELDQGKR